MSTVDFFWDTGKELPEISGMDFLTSAIDKNQLEIRDCRLNRDDVVQLQKGMRAIVRKKKFARVRFTNVSFKDVVFHECIFDHCMLLSTQFDSCEFHECNFINCNTNKIKFNETYIDPASFVDKIFDEKKYSNVGVNLFHTLYRNSIHECQPDFQDVAEYHFRVWARYQAIYRWKNKSFKDRIFDWKFFRRWWASFLLQIFSGYGLKTRYILVWTVVFLTLVVTFNYCFWDSFEFVSKTIQPDLVSAGYFTIATLTTLGAGELSPNSHFGMLVVSVESVLGLIWFALCTAMIVRRLAR